MRFKPFLFCCQVLFLSGFSIELLLAGIHANWLWNEQRSIPTCLEDISFVNHISQKLANDDDIEQHTNLNVTSYNKIVLLTGQTTEEAFKKKAYHYAINTPNIRCVFNQIRINTPISFLQLIHDRLLLEKIRIKLLFTSNIRYHHFKIVVEDSEVFILGKAHEEEIHLVTHAIQKTRGVKTVIKVIESA